MRNYFLWGGIQRDGEIGACQKMRKNEMDSMFIEEL